MKYYKVFIKIDESNFVHTDEMPDYEARRFIGDYIMGTLDSHDTKEIKIRIHEKERPDKSPKELYEEKMWE